MKYSRPLSGASESIVITGTPLLTALRIAGCMRAASSTDTRMPAGFVAAAFWNASASAAASSPSGPSTIAVTL